MCQVILTFHQVAVKGYHEYPFALDVGEQFIAEERGEIAGIHSELWIGYTIMVNWVTCSGS